MKTEFRTKAEEYSRAIPSTMESLLGELAGDELDVVGLVVERLQLGRGQYGQLDIASDRRDFAREAREESVDLLIYECIGALKKSGPALVITGDFEFTAEEHVFGEGPGSVVSAPHTSGPLGGGVPGVEGL